TTRYSDETVALGGRMYGQATTRSINAVFSLKSYLPFDGLLAWKEIRALPLAEQKRQLADPEVRRRLIADEARMKRKSSELQGGAAATQAGLRQSVPDARCRLGRSERCRSRRAAAEAPGRNRHRSRAGERQPRVCSAARQRVARGCPRHPEASAHLGDVLGFRRACLPGDGLIIADPSVELLG